jgi:UDP-MurNAc hydroxylase
MTDAVRIQFLNHASIRIITDVVTLVSDPWLSGSIFNDGWELIWTSEQLYPLAADSKFVWISHEHPDHFSPEFFRRLHGRRPEVLFQSTRDGRVARYLTDRGFTVHELSRYEPFPLSSREQFMIGRSGLYDSWSLFESAGKRILNINDCIVKTAADLRAIKKRVGHVDVLLTQFSYAGWVGSRHHKRLRQEGAKRRLDVVRSQLMHLEPDYVIPFASFVRFCHEENSYLNDSINRIPDFLDVCATLKSIPIVMKPMDTWCVGEAHDNAPATEFWERAYDGIPAAALRRTRGDMDVTVLKSQCAAYQSRIFTKNSRAWMKLLSALPFLELFRPVHIRLTDLSTTVRFNFFDELREIETEVPDIEIASDSLSYIFAHEFGFDTLLVNARCDAHRKGLNLAIMNFAIGNLNAMGWSIGHRMFGLLVHEFRLIWMVLRELRHVNPE